MKVPRAQAVPLVHALLAFVTHSAGKLLNTAFLLTLPDWVQDTWVRWAMLAAVVLIPLIVGIVSLRLVNPDLAARGYRLPALSR